jgi:hypothetical protein
MIGALISLFFGFIIIIYLSKSWTQLFEYLATSNPGKYHEIYFKERSEQNTAPLNLINYIKSDLDEEDVIIKKYKDNLRKYFLQYIVVLIVFSICGILREIFKII